VDFCSLNGGRWTVEGEVNTIKETVAVKGNFTISGMQKNYHNQLFKSDIHANNNNNDV
jgi:hypothetical protein